MVGYKWRVKRYNILDLEESLNALCRMGWEIVQIIDGGSEIFGPEIIVIAKLWVGTDKKPSPIRSVERQLIIETLDHNDDNYTQSAKDLGMARATFYKRMKNFGLIKGVVS